MGMVMSALLFFLISLYSFYRHYLQLNKGKIVIGRYRDYCLSEVEVAQARLN